MPFSELLRPSRSSELDDHRLTDKTVERRSGWSARDATLLLGNAFARGLASRREHVLASSGVSTLIRAWGGAVSPRRSRSGTGAAGGESLEPFDESDVTREQPRSGQV